MTTADDPTLDEVPTVEADGPVEDVKAPRKRPSRSRARADKAPAPEPRAPVGRPTNSAKLQRALAERFAMWSGLASVAAAGGDMSRYNAHGSLSRDCVIVSEASGELARCLVQASEANKALRRGLELVVQGGDQVELFTVLLTAVGLPILANHDLLPAGPLTAMVSTPGPAAPSVPFGPDGPSPHSAAA